MSKRRPPDVQAALRARGNPYWSLQIDDEAEAGIQRTHFRLLENPHAHDYFFGHTADDRSERDRIPAVYGGEKVAAGRGISKADFQKGCRLVFENYIPPHESPGLRKAHREFIARNQDSRLFVWTHYHHRRPWPLLLLCSGAYGCVDLI